MFGDLRRGWVHLSALSAHLAAESAARFPLIPMWWRTETKVISFPLLVKKCFSTLACFVTLVTDCAEGVIGCIMSLFCPCQFDLFLPFPLYHCVRLSTSFDMCVCVCAWFVTPLPVSLWSVSPLPLTCLCVCMICHSFACITVISLSHFLCIAVICL